MTKTISLLLFTSCFIFSHAFGQYTLDTPDGKKVKLKSNGTWQYVTQDEQLKNSSAIPKMSTAKYVDKYKKYAVWYDPIEWFYDTAKTNDALSWDATFYSKDQAITGYSMTSRLTMPVDELEFTMRQQWQDVGKITSFTTFKDTLNELPVLGFDMLLDFGGVTYQYRGYIHSTLKGSFQFMVGTQKEIFEEDKRKIELLFKGMTRL